MAAVCEAPLIPLGERAFGLAGEANTTRSRPPGPARARLRATDALVVAARPELTIRAQRTLTRTKQHLLGLFGHYQAGSSLGARSMVDEQSRLHLVRIDRATTARALSLLPLRRPHGPSRWLRRSRGRVLRHAARLDRPTCRRVVERPLRPPVSAHIEVRKSGRLSV